MNVNINIEHSNRKSIINIQLSISNNLKYYLYITQTFQISLGCTHKAPPKFKTLEVYSRLLDLAHIKNSEMILGLGIYGVGNSMAKRGIRLCTIKMCKRARGAAGIIKIRGKTLFIIPSVPMPLKMIQFMLLKTS